MTHEHEHSHQPGLGGAIAIPVEALRRIVEAPTEPVRRRDDGGTRDSTGAERDRASIVHSEYYLG